MRHMGSKQVRPFPDQPAICFGFIFAARPPLSDQETDISFLLIADFRGVSMAQFLWIRLLTKTVARACPWLRLLLGPSARCPQELRLEVWLCCLSLWEPGQVT